MDVILIISLNKIKRDIWGQICMWIAYGEKGLKSSRKLMTTRKDAGNKTNIENMSMDWNE